MIPIVEYMDSSDDSNDSTTVISEKSGPATSLGSQTLESSTLSSVTARSAGQPSARPDQLTTRITDFFSRNLGNKRPSSSETTADGERPSAKAKRRKENNENGQQKSVYKGKSTNSRKNYEIKNIHVEATIKEIMKSDKIVKAARENNLTVQDLITIEKAPDERNRPRCTVCLTGPMIHKSSVMILHCLGQKHLDAVKSKLDTGLSQPSYIKAVQKSLNTVGNQHTLHEKVIEWRCKVITAVIRQGIPVRKLYPYDDNSAIPSLATLLEEGSTFTLPSRSDWDIYVQAVHDEYRQRLAQQIKESGIVSVAFDFTPRNGEMMCVGVRFVSEDFRISTKFAYLKTVKGKALKGETISLYTLNALDSLSISREDVVSYARDRASNNDTAMTTLLAICPNAVDQVCAAHCFDIVGKKMAIEEASTFVRLVCFATKTSQTAAAEYETVVGCKPPSYSPTRWWSELECIVHVAENFPSIRQWIRECTGASQTMAKLRPMVLNNGNATVFTIIIQLAAAIDIGKELMKLTYLLEGDGPHCARAYHMITECKIRVNDRANMFNLSAVCRYMTGEDRGQPIYDGLWARGYQSVEPALLFMEKLTMSGVEGHSDLVSAMHRFKAAQLVHPGLIEKVLHDVDDSLPIINECLRQFPGYTRMVNIYIPGNPRPLGLTAEALVRELPTYRMRARGANFDIDILEWWRDNYDKVPCFAALARVIFTVPTSSADVERYFSRVVNFLGDQQTRASDNLIATHLFLQDEIRQPISKLYRRDELEQQERRRVQLRNHVWQYGQEFLVHYRRAVEERD